MKTMLEYLRDGFSREAPGDRLAGTVPLDMRLSLGRLVRIIGRRWHRAVPALVFILLGSLVALPQPLITRYLVDRVLLARALTLLFPVLLIMALLALLDRCAGFLGQFYATRFEQEAVLTIHRKIFDHLLQLPKSFFDTAETGYLMSRISSDVQGLRWFFSSTIPSLLTNLIQFFGGVTILFYLEWRLALLTVVLLPLVAVCIRYFSGRLRILSLRSMEQNAQVSGRFQEFLASLPLIKAFSTEGRTVDRMYRELQKSVQTSMEQSVTNAFAGISIQSLPAVSRGLALLAGGWLVIRGEWSLGSLLAFQACQGYVFGPLRFFVTVNFSLQTSLAALARVDALLNIFPEENIGTGTVVERLRGAVRFDGVSFAYDQGAFVLRDVSFEVPPGRRVAVVGPSGLGKTTLVSLILRFYKPLSGEIFYDGSPAGHYEVRSLRRRIGYVPQTPAMLSGTIEDNLRYGNQDATAEDLARACKTVALHDFIVRLPEGYRTPVSEGGDNFSEGQKQRLSMARALVKNPDILIFDEPTAAVDVGTEQTILSALPPYVAGKTIFIVAHRFSTVALADLILVLQEGGTVTVGTHTELLANNAYYRSLAGVR